MLVSMLHTALATLALTLVAVAPADAAPGSAAPAAGTAPAVEATAPPPAATAAPAFPLPDPAMMRGIVQRVAEMSAERRRLKAETREQMLSALSPAHRALVATLVGELAIAPNPDKAAAARRLTAMLSPLEQRAILAVNARALAEAQSIAQQTQSLFVSMLTPEQRSEMQRQFAQMKADIEKRYTPEQRAAIERQAAQMKAAAPTLVTGVFGGTSFPSTGNIQDAGSVLLQTLTTPDGPTLQLSPTLQPGTNAMPNAVIERLP